MACQEAGSNRSLVEGSHGEIGFHPFPHLFCQQLGKIEIETLETTDFVRLRIAQRHEVGENTDPQQVFLNQPVLAAVDRQKEQQESQGGVNEPETAAYHV